MRTVNKLLRGSRQFLHRWWRANRRLFCLFVFVVIPLKSSVADWNWVPTGSMNPTIVEGDLVYVNKVAYGLRVPLTKHRLVTWGNPERGDIVVLFSPEDGTRLVKRVIGLPGDVLEMRDNVVYVGGQALEYRPLDPDLTGDLEAELRSMARFAEEDLLGKRHAVMGLPGGAGRDFSRVRVPEGEYFVMGDSRDNSKDSRAFGFAERRSIVGRAEAVIVSFNKLDKYQPRFGRFFSGLE